MIEANLIFNRDRGRKSFFLDLHYYLELDRMEEYPNQPLQAFEFKWGNGEAKLPSGFRKWYPEADFTTVNRRNYLEFSGG